MRDEQDDFDDIDIQVYHDYTDRLEENGNGLPEFDLDLMTAFLVKERISPRGIEAKRYAIEQGFLVEENHEKPSQDKQS